MASEEVTLQECYSLLELIQKLGKEGVAALIAKGKPRRMQKNDMIYFAKADVNRLLGYPLIEEDPPVEDLAIEDLDQSVNLIVEDIEQDFIPKLVFQETLLKRHNLGQEEEIYRDKVLDLSQEILYGRTQGDPDRRQAFHGSGIISSLHAKIYLDEDKNLLYENLGANKSKVRGCKDKEYMVLGVKEIAVLIPKEVLQDICIHPQIVEASIKLGYQLKPHFIIRISVRRA